METKLYIIRHGKTMFNTVGRVQGWCDSLLTDEGSQGIRDLGAGLKQAGLSFDVAVSSDLGRTVQTMEIVQEELGIKGKIPYRKDCRLREWCFGHFEGGFGKDLFARILPQVEDGETHVAVDFERMAHQICEVDTTGWAEPWAVLKDRILEGFSSIAEELSQTGGGNALVVSHGMTIETLVYLLSPKGTETLIPDNGSVTLLTYRDGCLSVQAVGDMSYREKGKDVRVNKVKK